MEAKRTWNAYSQSNGFTTKNLLLFSEKPSKFWWNTKLKKSFKESFRTVKNWLTSQDTYTLYKPIRTRFQRRRVMVGGIDDQWQADLVDVSALSQHNDGYKFLLVCIDLLSKFAWVEPIKNKTGKSIVGAFSRVIVKRSPKRLQTDHEKEFLNALFQKFFKSKNIDFFTTYNDETKANVVERFNRTLKSKMWRYFPKNHTLRYVNVLTNLVKGYNKSFHRSIKTAPDEVGIHNEEQIWQNLYSNVTLFKKPKIPVGSTVRISKKRKNF